MYIVYFKVLPTLYISDVCRNISWYVVDISWYGVDISWYVVAISTYVSQL